MNHDEEMLNLTLAINHANVSPEASGSNKNNNNNDSMSLSLSSPAFHPGSSSESKDPSADGSGSNGGGGGSGPNGCRLKGVVQQHNGHWGAQIYANHNRIWLGTFKTELAAAMAYDSAALKLRTEKDGSTESYRNLEANPAILALESQFQSNFSTDNVLIMIKDGSYHPKFAEYCRTCQQHSEVGIHPGMMRFGGVNASYGNAITYTHSFEKELTPSDVGKLNRLVIPKKYAVKFFPKVKETNEMENSGNIGLGVGDYELDFFDTTMRRWSFRYCYWKSSQSFVFTKGWNKFVKEKGLKNKDVVIFYKCYTGPEAASFGARRSFSMIDVRHSPPQLEGVGVDLNGEGSSRVAEVEEQEGGDKEEGEIDEGKEAEVEADDEEEENEAAEEGRRVIKLFGVEIQ